MENCVDCERCDDTGLDPDRYTEQTDANGDMRYQAEPCADCQQTDAGETTPDTRAGAPR